MEKQVWFENSSELGRKAGQRTDQDIEKKQNQKGHKPPGMIEVGNLKPDQKLG